MNWHCFLALKEHFSRLGHAQRSVASIPHPAIYLLLPLACRPLFRCNCHCNGSHAPYQIQIRLQTWPQVLILQNVQLLFGAVCLVWVSGRIVGSAPVKTNNSNTRIIPGVCHMPPPQPAVSPTPFVKKSIKNALGFWVFCFYFRLHCGKVLTGFYLALFLG